MTSRELRFPMRGLSTDDSYANQPEMTTRDTRNMRPISPEHGRDRGAQRSGTSKYMATPSLISAGGDAVRLITSSVTNQKTVNYSETSSPAVDWDATNPSLRDCLNIASDRQSNVYAVDGDSALVKYNSQGREVWRLNLPADDAANKVRALAVDDFDVVYAGVSEGGSVDNARAWAYLQDFDGKPDLLWQLETGAFWEDIVISDDGFLYSLQNDTTNWKSYIRVYGAIDTSAPVLAWEREVPYPSNALAINKAGEVFVASPENADRGQNPFAFGDATAISEDWTPNDLEQASTRIWSWYDAQTIEDDDPTIEDQDELIRWRDKSGNGRDLFGTAGTGPKYLGRSSAGLPAVRFDGTDDELSGQEGDSVETNQAASQRTMLPGYNDAGYVLCMAVRCPEGSLARTILNRYRSHLAGVASVTRAENLFTNAIDGYGYHPGVASGKLFCRIEGTGSGTVGGAGTNGLPEQGDHSNDSNIAILSLVYDANSGGVTNGGLWRVNGDPVDRFDSDDIASTFPTNIGAARTSGGALETGQTHFDGDILEIVVLRDYTPTGGSRTIIEAPTYPDTATTTGTTELEQLEGYLAHRWGRAHEMDDGDPSIAATTANGPWPHPHFLDNGPPSTSGTSLIPKLNHTGAILGKFGATDGAPIWVLTDEDANPDITQDEIGGIGFGVAVDSDGDVFSVGPKTTNDNSVVRKVADKGDTFSLVLTDGAWSAAYDSNEDQNYAYPRLAVDKFDNLYVPKDATTSTEGLVVFLGDSTTGVGVEDYSVTFASEQRGRAVAIDRNIPDYEDDVVGGDPVERPEYFYTATSNAGGTGASGAITVNVVAIPDGDTFDLSDGTTTVTFEFDTSGDGVTGGNQQIFNNGSVDTGDVAFAILTAINVSALTMTADQFPVLDGPTVRIQNDTPGTAGNVAIDISGMTTASDLTVSGMEGASDTARTDTVFRIRAVDRTANLDPPRKFNYLAVAGQDIQGFNSLGLSSPVSGHINALANVTYVASATIREDIFFADGVSRGYKVFKKPTAANKSGEIVDFEATSGGRLEAGCQLLTSWQGRLVAARSSSFPANIFMSAQNDAYDFNYFLPVPRSSMAWEGNVRDTAGQAPNIVTGLVPWDDDTLIIGTDSSIEVLRGNPVDGGRIDQLSRVTGMAFGRAFTRDEENNIYFKSNKRGVMVITKDGQVRPLSYQRIERELSDIDLEKFRVELVWNYRDEGMHLFIFPQTGSPTLTEGVSYFWNKKTDSWWKDDWASTDILPTAAYVIDGDKPSDRTLLIGRNDSNIVAWDEEAFGDDGNAIDSYFVFGPVLSDRHDAEVVLQRMLIQLTEDLGGCFYDVFATDDPERLGNPVWSGELGSGRNPWVHVRGRGAYIYIRFRNAALNEGWAMEHGALQVYTGGRVRMRQ